MPRRPPPLRLLTVFEAVVRCGGMTRAASELNVTQPAVSQALKQLEEYLGATLFDRRTRPPQLTEAGLLLDAAARDGLARIGAAVDAIRTLAGGGAAVTIACSVGVATHWLMARLFRFGAEHPDIVVNVQTTLIGSPALAAGVDIAVRFGHGRWRDSESALLFEEEVRPVAAPGLRDRLAVDRTPLEAAPLLHVDVTDPSWLDWEAYARASDRASPRETGRRFTNYVQATQAALAGLGVMLGWRTITGDLKADGGLVALDAPAVTPRHAFYLSWSGDAELRESAAVLRDWLIRDSAEWRA